MKLQDNILESLKEQFTDLISNENVMVLKASDYQDERIPFMVIVGIDEYQVINVGCKDYRLTLKVVIDFFIEDDKEGYFFNQTRDQIEKYMEDNYLLTRNKLTNIEESIVGCFLEEEKNFVTDESNRAEIYYELISSSD